MNKNWDDMTVWDKIYYYQIEANRNRKIAVGMFVLNLLLILAIVFLLIVP